MATVVQAVCPKCGKQLRIPADWINQAMRCKHCSQVIQARQVNPAVRAATPPPPQHKAKNIPADYKQPPAKAPPANYTQPPAAVSAAPPVAPPMPAVPVAAPVGVAVAMPASGAHDPFGDIDDAAVSPIPSRRKPKAKGGWLVPLIVSGVLLAGILTGCYFLIPKITADLGEQGKSNNGPGDSGGEPIAKNTDLGKKPITDPNTRPNTDSGKKPNTDAGKKPEARVPFPRRALIISVHNYLFANVTPSGPPTPNSRNLANFQRGLAADNDKTAGLRLSPTQILHLSDAASKAKERTPLKPVIQEAVTHFLDESRPQDRIMVFFVGHGVEIGGEAYLVPIEGELENASTLLPLKWVYEQLAKCKARQKVFVVDVARYSPTEGRERPDGGPMSAKFEDALKNPPAGVQVWSACSAEQQSYATDDSPMGLFLDLMYESITSTAPGKSLQGVIQRMNDPIPIEKLNEFINKQMALELKPLKVEQVAKVYGSELPNGVNYDPKDGLAPTPTLPAQADMTVNKKSLEVVKSVLDEIDTPPVKVSRNDNGVHFEMLPPFDEATLTKYAAAAAPEDSKLRPAIMKARAVLWAVAADSKNLKGPLNTEVNKIKKDVGVNLSVLREGYRAPANEGPFKTQVANDERQVAKILGALQEAHEELKAAAEDKDKESKRWQANYDFILARVEAQIAHLVEYQALLGAMRKELPPRDAALHGGWRLAAQLTLTGSDRDAKKMFESSRKGLDKLIKDHKGTPWEVLAKREKLTALGLAWKPTR
jgi:Caspase domain